MKREFLAYFYSPIAYVVIIIFMVISGFFFYSGMALYAMVSFEMSRAGQSIGPQELALADFVLRPLFSNLSIVMLMMMPLLTMRLFSEEMMTGSIELLYTWPLKDSEVLLGKYFAAVLMFVCMMAPTLSFTGLIWYYSDPPWLTIACGYLGLLLLGSAFLSLGLFVSTMTKNQIVSSAISFGALLVFWIISWAAGEKSGVLPDVLNYLSILRHYDQFSKGVIDTRDVIYYLSFIFLFLFLTFRSLESRSFRG
jgi:ABC-2 type transport system permease protein